jgi:hypothetical protein
LPAVLFAERALDPATVEQIARLDAFVFGNGAEPLAAQADAVAAFLQRVRQASRRPRPPPRRT